MLRKLWEKSGDITLIKHLAYNLPSIHMYFTCLPFGESLQILGMRREKKRERREGQEQRRPRRVCQETSMPLLRDPWPGQPLKVGS